MNQRIGKIVLCLVVGAAFALVLRQHAKNAALREEVAKSRVRTGELATLRDDQANLVAQQVSAEELARLRADEAEAARLRSAMAALRAEVATPSTPAADANQTPPQPFPPPWSNAGRETPDATFCTGVWAALQGETAALADLITFDAESRPKLEAMFALLPENVRAEYGTAEKVFATLLAARVPQDLAAAAPISRKELGPDEMLLRMEMKYGNGGTKTANFHFTRASEGWRIVVPAKVVEDYQHMLSSSPTFPNSK